MKKILAGAFAAATIAGGVVATTTTGAVADPYPATVDTTCHSYNVGKANAGDDVSAYFSVAADNSNATPHGRAIFHYERLDGKFSYDFDKYFAGGEKTYTFEPMHRGNYTVTARFDSRPDESVFQNCRTSFDMKVSR